MLGEEHYTVLLSQPISRLRMALQSEWLVSSKVLFVETSTSRQRMVVVCLSIRGTYDARESYRKGMDLSIVSSDSGNPYSHDKAKAKSLDDRGSVGYLLDIDVWQSGAALCRMA